MESTVELAGAFLSSCPSKVLDWARAFDVSCPPSSLMPVAALARNGPCLDCSGLSAEVVLNESAAPTSGRGLELDGPSIRTVGFVVELAKFCDARDSCSLSTIAATLLLTPDAAVWSACHTLKLVLPHTRLRLFLLLGQSLPVLAHLLNTPVFAGVSSGRGEPWNAI